MNETLKDRLIFFNKGIYRGAQRKFAKALGVGEGTVSNWLMGRGTPSEQAIIKMAEILKAETEVVRSYFPKISATQEYYEGFKRRGLINIEQSTGDVGETLNLTISKEIADKFRAICKFERRDQSAQMEIILEQYFAQREHPTEQRPGEYPKKEHITDDTVIWPSKKHLMPAHPPAQKQHAPRSRGAH